MPIATAYTVMGNFKMAMEWLEKAYSSKGPGISVLVLSPFFDPLYGFSDFLDFLKKVYIVPRKV